jgi:hypothetical protein
VNPRKRLLIAALLGITVFAVVFAVAASLTVTSSSLGAGASTVASRDRNGVATSFGTSYRATAAC